LFPIGKYPVLEELTEGCDNVLGGTESADTDRIIDVWNADVLMDGANDVDKGAKIVVLGDDGT
jgi:hypothetical protein